ncbi:DNA helicase PIF1, ATP-dependent [Tanacetum coccineum]
MLTLLIFATCELFTPDIYYILSECAIMNHGVLTYNVADAMQPCGMRKEIIKNRLQIQQFFTLACPTRIDHLINVGRGLYTFRINGQNYHIIGSLLPKDGTQPRYAQLWFFDTHNEVKNWLGAFIDKETGKGVDGTIVGSLIEMLDQNSSIAKAFRMALDWCHSHTYVNVELRLVFKRTNSRQYNAPTVAEVVALITNDFGDGAPTRDIVVNKKDRGPKRISELHPSYMALQYPLLFLYGEDGYHDKILSRTRVFKLKLTELLDDLTKNQVFGESRVVIEFQKRGLPHVHILLWLEEHCKCKTASDIDDIISAELPSPMDDPVGYKSITDYMLHGPCGKDARYAACNVEGKCSKHFSKAFCVKTIFDQDGYPIYHQRDNKVSVKKAPCEAVWRILSFDVHYAYPSVIKLNFYLPNQHPVTLRDSECLPALLEREGDLELLKNFKRLTEEYVRHSRRHVLLMAY